MPKGTGSLRHIFLAPSWREKYELRDEFSSPLVAGSVNGTAAEPGPGTRVVTDTENKLSIANGVLTISGGKASPAYGDPGAWLDAVTRVAGRVLLGRLNNASGANMQVGWSASQSGVGSENLILMSSPTVLRYYDGSSANQVATTVAATNYSLAIVLRAVGSFLFIKGGAFTDWTLLWVGGLKSTATLYPAVINNNTVFTVNFLRAPRRLWLPAPLLSDGFGLTTSGTGWTRQATVFGSAGSNASQCTVIYEVGAQILSGTVFKAWYNVDAAVYYAESADGLTWTQHGSNPIIAAAPRVHVVKVGATYYAYYTAANNANFLLATSSDGIVFGAGSNVMALGAGGQWDDSALGNMRVWSEGASDFRALYEAKQSGGVWKIGYATSSDGSTWSKSGSNPVLSASVGIGGPFLYKRGAGDYYMWAHYGGLPTDVVIYKSSNLTGWTAHPVRTYFLPRMTADEGAGASGGQTGDASLVEVAGTTYIYYSAMPNQTSSTVKVATAPLTLADLTALTEGMGDKTDGVAHAEANGGGGLAWQSTSGIWSIAINKAVGSPVAGADVVANANMETGDPPSSWTASNATLDGVADERTGGAGIQSLDIVASAASGDARQTLTVVNKTWYRYTWWVKKISGTGVCQTGLDGIVNFGASQSTSWTPLVYVRLSAETSQVLKARLSVNLDNYRVDDFSAVPLALSELFSTVDVGQQDVLVDADVVVTAGTQAGVVLNLDDATTPANFAIAYHDGTNAKLDKCVAGVYTSVISAAATYSAGATLRVIKDGTSYQLFYNNAGVGSTSTISDAGIISNTIHGLFNTYSGNTMDNFVVYARGTGGEYEFLSRFVK